tara:strand:- start:155421 stop:156998 length:1578 start_codon:yes stop_codon:yes gene_type:complete
MAKKADLRILLIHTSGAELFAWTGGQLIRSESYPAEYNGYVAFSGELARDPVTPFFIVVDCIEEDFRHDTIAHVGGSDRRELMRRKLKFQFRNTPYRVGSVIGREKSGRRDDNVLFSALTKPEMLDPWTEALLQRQVPVKGINTPAYLMQQFAKQRKLNHEHLILVNIESVTGIRQTYLKNGKVMFSRLSPWNHLQNTIEADKIQEQVLQSRKYLERIKLIPYDRPAEVLVFTYGNPLGDAQLLNAEQLNYSIIDTAELSVVEKVSDALVDECSALTLALSMALRKRHLKNQYAPFDIRRYFHIRQIRNALLVLGAGTLISTAAVATPVMMGALEKSDSTDALEIRVRPLLQDYEQLRLGFPETPIPSNTMAVVVETYDNILRQSLNPAAAMVDIGNALRGISGLRLTRFDWSLNMSDERQQAAEQELLAGARVTPESQFVNAVIAGETLLRIQIEGRVENTSSYQLAQAQVENFVEALRTTEEFEVTPLQMPLDASPAANVTTVLDGRTINAPFAIEIKRSLAP